MNSSPVLHMKPGDLQPVLTLGRRCQDNCRDEFMQFSGVSLHKPAKETADQSLFNLSVCTHSVQGLTWMANLNRLQGKPWMGQESRGKGSFVMSAAMVFQG